MPDNEAVSIETITQEIDTIAKKLESKQNTEKYNAFSKAILIANYFLFVTIVWKSFELQGNIPVSAKISLILFGIGALFSVLRYLADYIAEGMENIPEYRKLIEIERKHKDKLKEYAPEEYMKLKLCIIPIKRSLEMHETKDIPSFVLEFIYGILDISALLLSFIFLTAGLFFLGISAM